MARALVDPMLSLEVKEQLFQLWERRQWPQEIEDREGNTWLYRQGKPPVLSKKGDKGNGAGGKGDRLGVVRK
jgi:hypothetical protein